jgi:hypothetical protein
VIRFQRYHPHDHTPFDWFGEAMGDAYAARLAINILNSSGTTLAIGPYSLTGGEWESGHKPDSRYPIDSGGTVVYANIAPHYFSGLGGSMVLYPMTGGWINVNWSWPSGKAPTGWATPDSTTGIEVNSSLIGVGSSNVTLQVVLTNL